MLLLSVLGQLWISQDEFPNILIYKKVLRHRVWTSCVLLLFTTHPLMVFTFYSLPFFGPERLIKTVYLLPCLLQADILDRIECYLVVVKGLLLNLFLTSWFVLHLCGLYLDVHITILLFFYKGSIFKGKKIGNPPALNFIWMFNSHICGPGLPRSHSKVV